MYLDILFLQSNTAFSTGCFWTWALGMFLSFVLGILLGKWVWGRYAKLVSQKNKKINTINTKYSNLEKEFIAVKYKCEEAEKDNKGLKASLTSYEQDMHGLRNQLLKIRKKDINYTSNKVKVTEGKERKNKAVTQKETILKNVSLSTSSDTTPAIAATAFNKYLKKDDLKIIEGIGPKIEEILFAADITSLDKLANTDNEKLQKTMEAAGPRYRIHDPKTWNEQAKMAIAENWDHLMAYQVEINTNRINSDQPHILTKLEKVLTKKLGYSTIQYDDLKVVEGIGPKIEQLLKAGGINNWQDLSETAIERFSKLLEDSGTNFQLADPTTWSKQASLALERNWLALKAFQDNEVTR